MTKILYLGHSAVMILNESGNIIIDPFFTNNPLNPMKVSECKAKYILVTHGHSDHLGDAIEIAKNNEAKVITNFEIAQYLSKKGVENLVPMNIGGVASFENFSVKMVEAIHSSSIEDGNKVIYGGNPAGFVVKLPDLTVYHAGDTALFANMEFIGGQNVIDIAFLPIGSTYTMDINDALMATKILHPKMVIPIHYNTWDTIKVDVNKFKEMVEKETRSSCIILNPGEAI